MEDPSRWSGLEGEISRGYGPEQEVVPPLPPGTVPGAVAALLEGLGRRAELGPRYSGMSEVGHGGMGRVFRSRDLELGRPVAMKVLELGRPDGTPEEQGLKQADRTVRFVAEAQITGQLDHPGIVPVHELGIDSLGKVFFTMKLVNGHDLGEIFGMVRSGTGGWTVVRALGVMLKVCEAMAFAHSKGVIHRDLKPANIMVGRFGETYVMDWGIARVLGRDDMHDLRWRKVEPPSSSVMETVRDDAGYDPHSPLLTMDGRVLGTPAYMAPEQAAGFVDEISPCSDVYSLGAILYELLTGTAPYMSSGGPRAVLERVLAGPPSPIRSLDPSVPEELVVICERAMARRKSLRYASALELAQNLRAYLEHRPLPAHPPSLRHALRLWIQRNRAVAATAASAAFLVLAMVVWFAVHQESARRRSQRMGDAMAASALLGEQREALNPLLPEDGARCRRWLGRVGELLQRLPGYRTDHEQGRSLAPLAGDEVVELLGSAEALEAARALVEGWLADAEQQPARAAAAPQTPWSEVFEDLSRQAAFRQLELRPQEHLVPLGRNAAGNWMFWHVPSGACPEVVDGVPHQSEATGIVLVLLPAGEVTIGNDQGQPNERPQGQITMRPLLLAMHETSQAQYLHVTGENPARCVAGKTRDGVLCTLLHPVEQVSWYDAERLARRLALRLPTAAELEYAGRADRPESPLFGGLTAGEMRGRENIADQAISPYLPIAVVPWNDGFPETSPVGLFVPNAFGLCDMAGNVSEWTATFYGPDDAPFTEDPPGTPLAHRLRCLKGGNFGLQLDVLRASYFSYYRPGYASHWVGVRLARDWR